MSIKGDLERVLKDLGNEKIKILTYFSSKTKGYSDIDEKGVTRIENWIQLELMYQLEMKNEYNNVNCEVGHDYHLNKIAQSVRAIEKNRGVIDVVCRPPNNSNSNRFIAIELKVKHTASRSIKGALMDLIKTRRYKESSVTIDENGSDRGYRAIFAICIYKELNSSGYQSIVEHIGAKPIRFGKDHWLMVIGWEDNPSKEPKLLWKSYNDWVNDNIIRPAEEKGLKLTH